MTFSSAPWALDGARTSAALARSASYAESGGVEGIILAGDLKVSPLDVPAAGLQIASGGALLLNRYQTLPRETYTARNVGTTLLDSSSMPPADPAARSHLVCVTIGDPEFSQVGHPWMTSDPIPAEQVETFQYVRAFVIANVPSTTTSFEELGLEYPALALARIDVPANTSTITSDMIVDLRKVARPRRETITLHNMSVDPATYTPADVYTWFEFGSDGGWDVKVPEWATSVEFIGYVEAIGMPAAGGRSYGYFRVAFPDAAPVQQTLFDEQYPAQEWIHRATVNLGGSIDLPASYQGATKRIRIEYNQQAGGLVTAFADVNTNCLLQLTFVERAV